MMTTNHGLLINPLALDTFLKHMVKSAGVKSTDKTNHILWATAIPCMLDSNVATKMMMERFVHLHKKD